MPPVKVTSVVRAAVGSAIDNAVPPSVLDAWSIKRLGDHWINRFKLSFSMCQEDRYLNLSLRALSLSLYNVWFMF